MTRTMAGLLAAFLALLSAPGWPRAQASSSELTQITDDPLVMRIVGIYRSDADPKGHVAISSHGRGVVAVTWGTVWDAIGFWDGREFRGTCRAPFYGVAKGPGERMYGELSFRSASGDTLSAQLTLGSKTSNEFWVPAGRFASSTTRPGRASDSLPAPGDYVYVEELPEALTRVNAAYPEQARKKGIDGTVIVQALVGRGGKVLDAMVVKSIPGLDEAAKECVRQWTFKPAMAGGKPVAVWVAIPVKFTLH